ncbi:MAG: hypothetical protein ACTHJQ_22720 [Rhizobiaceae bacterium]
MTIGTPITTPDNTKGKVERVSTRTGCRTLRITDEAGHQGWFVASECRVR